MDQNLTVEEKKNKIMKEITGILIAAMEQGKVNSELGQEIAAYILNESKSIIDEETLNNFLKQLAEKYSLFKSYFGKISFEDQIKETNDEKMIDIREKLLKLANFTNQ